MYRKNKIETDAVPWQRGLVFAGLKGSTEVPKQFPISLLSPLPLSDSKLSFLLKQTLSLFGL